MTTYQHLIKILIITILFCSFNLQPLQVKAHTGHPHFVNEDEFTPATPLHPPGPMIEEMQSTPNCETIPCAGQVPTHQVTSSSVTSNNKRTRGSNTQLVIPQNILLADVNADGASDFIQYAENRIFVSKTDFEKTGILHLYLARPIKRIFTGDFAGAGYDQICVITDDIITGRENVLTCYTTRPDHRQLGLWFMQGQFASDEEDLIVGDFDGDGRDDVLVYQRAGGPYRMYSVKGDFFFEPMPAFSQGNLEGAVGAGMQLRAGDFTGDGRTDLLAVNPHGQILRYDSVHDGANNTFWWAFTTVGGLVSGNDQITVARIDDNAIDDVVLRDRVTGATRFFQLEWADGLLPAISNVSTGQIDVAGDRLLFWGFMHGSLSEPGAVQRDDAMVYDLGTNMFVRSDARWDGNGLTYWWAYTQVAPNNHTGWAPFAAKPWLILKCKFSDIDTTPKSDLFYQNLNSAHVEYWRDLSYGSWDLSGSIVVNEWQFMLINNEEWKRLPRLYKTDACIKVFRGSTSGYVNVISIVNGEGDAGNVDGRVLLTPDSSDITWMGHETGHTFGWGHSFDDTARKNADWSAPGEYFDHWDIMSGANVHTYSHPNGFLAGPEMNAPYRTKQAFIPAHRILRLTSDAIAQGTRFNLAALNHPEANGPLMVRIGADDTNYYTIEYRIQSGWDQGITQSTVLVHRVTNGTSILLTTNGAERLVGSANTFSVDGQSFTLRVNSFEIEGYTADVIVDGVCKANSEQAALFVDVNYTGACVTKSIADYANPGSIGLPNDSVSSIKVGAGAAITLCRDDGHMGICEQFMRSDPDLTDNDIGNDQVSSISLSKVKPTSLPTDPEPVQNQVYLPLIVK